MRADQTWSKGHHQFQSLLLMTLLLLVAATGCRLSSPVCHHVDPPHVEQNKTSIEPISLDSIRKIRIPFVDKTEQGHVPGGFEQVYPLSLRDCELLAAQNSPLSRMLEVDLNQGPCQPCSNVDPCLRESVNSIVMANSSYQRNVAAEQALLAYFGLVEVYLQNQIANETVAEIESLQEVLMELQNEGLLKEIDPETLVRQKIETISQQQEILFNFEKLNESLRALLGLESHIHPIWTDCQIAEWQTPENLAGELDLAFAHRQDLQGIQELSMISGDAVLNVLTASVRSASPLAGMVLERRLFNGYFSDNSVQINKLRKQLAILHSAQVDLAKATVTEQFYSIHKNYEQIQLNRQKLGSLRKSEARLEAKRQVGPIKVEEVLTVKSDILKCRSKIIHSAIEMQTSWIRMKAAQGLLGQTLGPQGFELDSYSADENVQEFQDAETISHQAASFVQPDQQSIPSVSHRFRSLVPLR